MGTARGPPRRPDDPHAHRFVQRVHAEKSLSQQPPGASARNASLARDFTTQLAGIHGYYASRIAAVRATMRPGQAEAMIRNLRNEKMLAIRNAKDRRRAEKAARKSPPREPVRPAFKAAQIYRRCG